MSILTKRTAKRSFASVVAAAMIASVLALIAVPASAGTTVTMKRYSGIDRYATSALAATGAFATGGDNVVLVSGENYADGLAAAGLAGALTAPVLLTHPTTLLGSTANAIGTIDTGTSSAATALKVTIIGGVNAVSAGVATSLTGLGYTVERISGADRYATAVAVGDKLRALSTVGSLVGKTTAIVVSGTSFPDGLAAGGMAYLHKSPILLTNGTSLGASNTTFLNNEVNPVNQVLIVGGTAAVSAAVATEIAAIKNGLVAINVMRVSGADRYATALELAKFRAKATVLQGNAETVTNIMLVSGESFADALSSAAKAGAAATMTLLTTASAVDSATAAWVASKYASINNLFVTGGTSAISTATATSVKTGATTVKVTPTISAPVGSKVLTVTYPSLMTFTNNALGNATGNVVPVDGVGAADTDGYKLNNTELVIDTVKPAADDDLAINGAVMDLPAAGKVGTFFCANSTTATTCAVVFGTAFAVGDVITVGSTTTPASAVGSRAATGSYTVVADVTAPTATWDTIQIGGTRRATFTMSETVQSVNADGNVNMTHVDVVCGTTAATAIAQIAGTLTFLATLGADIAAGDKCTLAANYKDVAGVAATKAAVSAVAVTDTTGATVSAKLTKTTYNGAATATMGTGGTFIVTAKSAGAYKGAAGNAWSVEMIAGVTTSLPTVSLYDTVQKKIVVSACVATATCSAGKAATAQNIVDALNAHTEIAANFVATVIAAGNSTAVQAATSLAGGTAVFDIVLTANEIMGATAANDYDDGQFTADADGAGTGTAACTVTQDAADLVATPNASDYYKKAINITCTATTTSAYMTTGVSHIVASANVKDFNQNVIPTAGRKIILQAG